MSKLYIILAINQYQAQIALKYSLEINIKQFTGSTVKELIMQIANRDKTLHTIQPM